MQLITLASITATYVRSHYEPLIDTDILVLYFSCIYTSSHNLVNTESFQPEAISIVLKRALYDHICEFLLTNVRRNFAPFEVY